MFAFWVGAVDDDLVGHATGRRDEPGEVGDVDVAPAGVDDAQPAEVEPQRDGPEPVEHVPGLGVVEADLGDELLVLVVVLLAPLAGA